MPKYTTKKFLRMSDSLTKVLAAKLDYYVSYRIKKWVRAVSEALINAQDTQQKIFHDYSVVTPDGRKVKPDQDDEYQAAWQKVLAEDVVLPNIQLTLKELKPAELTAIDISNLDDFIKGETGDDDPEAPADEPKKKK